MGVEEIEQAIQKETNPAEQAPEAKEQPVGDSAAVKETPKDDPEFDLGADDKGQPMKFKRSQILEFQKGSMLQKDYTTKTQEIAAQRKELEEMFKIVDHLKTNPQKAEKIIAILDEKEQVLEEKKDEIDQLLSTLPEDDPYAKGLRALKRQTQEALKSNKTLQEKLDGYEKKTASVEESTAVKQAEEVLKTALDENLKTLTFEDDDDKKEWRNAVLTYLVNNPSEYRTQEEFQAALKTVSDAQHKAIVARNERITARYIQKKGDNKIPSHPGGDLGKPPQKIDADNLQDVIREELILEESRNKG